MNLNAFVHVKNVNKKSFEQTVPKMYSVFVFVFKPQLFQFSKKHQFQLIQ